jgi:Zn finger protein HypA/HybF involved in hydrogenase expression
MPATRNFPFRRLAVDHLIRGNSRVWWQIEETFKPDAVCYFQLQFSHTGTDNAKDWENVGTPIVDAFYAIDDEQRLFGKTLNAFYRVTLTVGTATYVSNPTNVFGELTQLDLLQAREILRKEKLRNGRIAVDGFLLKKMRYGAKCPRCRDHLSGEALDSVCPICNGTGTRIGYHPAVPLCVDKGLETISETTDPEVRGPINDEEIACRIAAFPMVQKEDIWVDGQTDQRWTIGDVKFVAARRSMPIILQVTMKLLPFTDIVYRLPLCETVEAPEPPDAGSGCVSVDHDYGGTDNFRYLSPAGVAVEGATVAAYTQDVFEQNSAQPPLTLAVAATQTDSDGRWTTPLLLNPGDYVLVFEKPGHFGPDTGDLHVPKPADESSSSAEEESFWG